MDPVVAVETDDAKPCSFGSKNTKLFWSHSIRLLEQLNALRSFETFCDVVIHVGDNTNFSAHRCILAACSAKLYALMFTASRDCSTSVHLDGVTARGFKILLEFIYTGILSIDTDTVTDTITAASHLEMPAVVRICEEFISSRRAADGNDGKVGGNSSPHFTSTTIGSCTQTSVTESQSQLSVGRLEHTPIAGLGSSSMWSNRFTPSGDAIEDLFSMFEPSFDQYYSSCKERAPTVRNCDRISDTVMQQSRNPEFAHCLPDLMDRRHHGTDDSLSGRNCNNLRHQAFSNVHEDRCLKAEDRAKLPFNESASDIALKLLQNLHTLPAESNGKLQSVSQCHSEPLAHGARSRLKRTRKSETPGRVKTNSSPRAKSSMPKSGRNRQKSVRRKPLMNESVEEEVKTEPDVDLDVDVDKEEMQSADNDTVYTCDDCGKEFPCSNVLTRHKRTAHSAIIFHCSECATDFHDPATFKRHSVVIHGIRRPFSCTHPQCRYRSDRLSNVEKHVSIHSPDHAFACSRCGRTFAQDAGLRSHLLSCTESRSYLCDLCGSAFNHLQSMQSHRRVHTGERPYRCTDCDSSFADHRNYKRHRRIHDNSFPYACVLCGKRFRHSNSLKSHLGSHGIMSKPTTSN